MNIPLNDNTVREKACNNCYYGIEETINDCVRDFNHLNKKFRGYAHSKCNLQT